MSELYKTTNKSLDAKEAKKKSAAKIKPALSLTAQVKKLKAELKAANVTVQSLQATAAADRAYYEAEIKRQELLIKEPPSLLSSLQAETLGSHDAITEGLIARLLGRLQMEAFR